MLILTIEGDNPKQYRFDKGNENIFLGRVPACDIILNDNLVSSTHGRIVKKKRSYFYEDLISTNGTVLKRNGKTIVLKDNSRKIIILKHKDILILGNTTIKCSIKEDKKIIKTTEINQMIQDKGSTIGSETIFLKQNLKELDEINEQVSSERSNLQLLNKMLGAFKLEDGRERLLNLIADTISEALKHSENIIILLKGKDGRLQPVLKRLSTPDPDNHGNLVSSTIIKQVMDEKVAIFYTNAQKEASTSESIIDLHIMSAICVPLWNRNEITGILQVDNRSKQGMFTKDNLSLITVLGHYAAIAIDNLTLYEDAFRAKKKEEQVRKIFQKYVPQEIVNNVLKKGSESLLTVEKKNVTILFSDIRGFTAISEKMAPEDLVKLLNQYFDIMIKIISRHNGVLDKFLGDGILAVFGAPITYENDALNGVISAMEMIKAFKKFSEILGEKGMEPFKIGIGIHTGPVVAGNIGSDDRMEYTVIGDTVNTTNRIETLTAKSPDTILISETTYHQVKDYIKVIDLGHMELKGKSDKIRVYQVAGLKK